MPFAEVSFFLTFAVSPHVGRDLETMGISPISMSFTFLSGELEHERGRELISSDVSYLKHRQGIFSESVIQALQSSVESHFWRVV